MSDELDTLRREIALLLTVDQGAVDAFDADTLPADPETEACLIVGEAVARAPDRPRDAARELAERRRAGELLGHILGRVEFLGCELLTDTDCLVPRKETEIVARAALERLRHHAFEGDRGPWCVDMCCGAGNIACALAFHLPSCRVWASDLTGGCVNLARRNAEHLGLGDRVTVQQGDLFASLVGQGLEGKVDLVACNPPYISSGRLGDERATLLEKEPREAFDGGPYGLSIHQRVLQQARDYLRPGGHLLFEIGLGQERQFELLVRRTRGAYGPVQWYEDAQGRPRAAGLERA